MVWETHVAYMREMRSAYNIWSEKLKERDHIEDLVIEGRIVLKWILEK
jgi:hypothetical protein